MRTENPQRGRHNHNSEPEDLVAEEPRPRIPPGQYDAYCLRTEFGRSFGGRRDIYILFKIHGGEFDGIELFMACTHPKGKVSSRCKYYQQWTLAAGRPPRRREPLSREAFPDRMYRILVRDTRKKHGDGSLMADCVQYSVVDSIVEPLTGGPQP